MYDRRRPKMKWKDSNGIDMMITSVCINAVEDDVINLIYNFFYIF